MDVDEAGGENEAFGVDNLFAGLRLEIRGDGDDAVAGDADVGFAEGGAGAVGDFGVDDERWSCFYSELARGLSLRRRQQLRET